MRQRLLRPEDRDKLEALAQRTLKQGTPAPSWKKEGDHFISLMGRANAINPKTGADERLARGLDDWNEWVASNPQATREQARKEWQVIGRSVSMVDPDRLAEMTMLTPSYAQPAAADPAGKAARPPMDFDATIAATRAAFQKGEIDQYEAGRQMLLIEKQQQAWQTQQAAGAQ